MKKYLVILAILFAAHWLPAQTLVWDAVPDQPEDPRFLRWTTYTVYAGVEPHHYTWSGYTDQTHYPLATIGLQPGVTYFLAVTATYHSCWTANGCFDVESAFSLPVPFRIELSSPPPLSTPAPTANPQSTRPRHP